MSRYVIALGGNALADSSLSKAADTIARLYCEGNEIVITHGNGPQVGKLAQSSTKNLAALTKRTEISIGRSLKKAIGAALRRAGSKKAYSTAQVVTTRVIVEAKGKEFSNPSKPIGRFYSKEDAKALSAKGLKMKKLVGGYRRVVPSPSPKRILEIKKIVKLLRSKKIVIACGGGGMAVTRKHGTLAYVDAVIDKDRASALLAIELKADRLAILTNVDGACLNFAKRNQKVIGRIRVGELSAYLKKGAFEQGSMKPKVESCIAFVKACGKEAVIASMARPEEIILEKRATIVTR